MTEKLQKLQKELAELNNRALKWEEEQKNEPGKYALGFNALGEEIAGIDFFKNALNPPVRTIRFF
jgi:lipid II:glycine glycyltransferase (peptidoglycan interpeptide bridge formation enzyme)